MGNLILAIIKPGTTKGISCGAGGRAEQHEEATLET